MRPPNLLLSERLGKRFPDLSAEDIARMMHITFDMLIDATAADKRAEIRGFGTFYMGRIDKRLMRNPNSGEMMEVPDLKRPRFRAGVILRKRINRKT